MHETPMLRDVGRQPDILLSMLARAAEFRAAGERLGPGGRILVTSCGDGHFAAMAAAVQARQLGLDWHAMGPMELLVAAETLKPSDRIVAISMSGNVDRTVEAVAAAEARGLGILAVVNGTGGKLASLASNRISLDLPDIAPFLCGTASYTATLAALLLIAQGVGGAAAQPPLAMVEAQRHALAASEAVLPGLLERRFTGVRLLAAGAELGNAAYGAAKLVELTRLPAWSGELEEFAHSQYWSMPATDLVVCIATDPVVAGYARESCRALKELRVETLAIDTAATAVDTASRRMTLPVMDPAFAPLASAIPLQLLAYRLSEQGGLDPNTRRHLKDDELRFRVSRMLTRRSLLGTGF